MFCRGAFSLKFKLKTLSLQVSLTPFLIKSTIGSKPESQELTLEGQAGTDY